MKHRIALDSLSHEFRLLRNRIEAEVTSPAVLLVTSATRRDGAALTAYGLAESLCRTHQRTALLTTSVNMPTEPQWSSPMLQTPRRRASDRLEVGSTGVEGGMSIVSVSQERLATISRSNMAQLVDGLRKEHDYVIIDGGGLPDNTFSLLLLASADAVLISFLQGRQQTAADRAMVETLDKAEAKVLGVVMNDETTIEHFEETVTKHEPGVETVAIADKPSASMRIGQRLEVALQRIGRPL